MYPLKNTVFVTKRKHTGKGSSLLQTSSACLLLRWTCRDHLQLGQELDCIDFDTAAEVSGSKFVYLKRAAALLELALVNYAMQKVVSKGFVPMMTPDLVRESVLEKCGFQPRGTETQVGALEWILADVMTVSVRAFCLFSALV